MIVIWSQVRALCNGVVETMGRVTYDGKVKHPVTAHPKVDPETGELSSHNVCLHFESHTFFPFASHDCCNCVCCNTGASAERTVDCKHIRDKHQILHASLGPI